MKIKVLGEGWRDGHLVKEKEVCKRERKGELRSVEGVSLNEGARNEDKEKENETRKEEIKKG